jgi:hypothetical protein
VLLYVPFPFHSTKLPLATGKIPSSVTLSSDPSAEVNPFDSSAARTMNDQQISRKRNENELDFSELTATKLANY